MTDEPKHVMDVDGLLRRACADDLTADVGAAMRRRISSFLDDAQDSEQRASGRRWPLPRVIWTTISILMLLAGVLLQGARVSSPLADRISSLKAAYTSLETTRR